MIYGPGVQARFAALHFGGDLPGATAACERTNPACGDVLRYAVTVEEGRIARIRWKALGCPPTLAAADVLAEMAEGAPVSTVLAIGPEQVAARLEGLPPTSRHAAQLAVETLEAVLQGLE